jgi:hypothetical protein
MTGLLRARRERPRRCRAAEKLDQFSPLHVSRATVWRSLSGWPAAQSGYHGGTGQVLCFRCRRAERHRLLRMQVEVEPFEPSVKSAHAI